jgi:hypothetical protein
MKAFKKGTMIWILIAVVGLFIAAYFYTPAKLPTESFTNTTSEAPTCPTSAYRDGDGIIHVEPGNRTFQSLQDYVSYLSGIFSEGKNATCIPPVVKMAPLQGMLGGQGTGTISPDDVGKEGPDRTVLDMGMNSSEWDNSSAQTPIGRLDDYEYSRVYQSEKQSRNSPLSKETKDKLLSQRILDWASLPFNSEERAEQEDEFIAGRMENGFRDPKTGVFFSNMEGKQVLPPDEEALKLKEAALLSAYRPTEITKHVMDSETERVADLVSKMYAEDPNWEPVVEKTGPHKWAVTELRPKTRKEKWEDAQTVSIATAEEQGIATVNPSASIQIYDRQRNDPYFDKQGIKDSDNDRFWAYQDFNKWTPGLERMFAPTAENKAWY